MHCLKAWLTSYRMSMTAPKSFLTLVTPYNREYLLERQVTLFDSPIPVGPHCKILVITLARG